MTVALSVLMWGLATAGRTDTDIWGHMSIGLDMIASRAFLWVDPYSFTHDQTWINHEWGWDLISAAVYRLGKLPLLVALRGVLIGTVLWCVHRATRDLPGWLRLLALAVAAVGCIGQWRSTRPQLATLALYSLLLTHLDAVWLPALFLAWANLHGGWLFGLAAVASRAVLMPKRRRLTLALFCGAATLVNPYGYHLWTAIIEASRRGWSDISEWQPVWRLSAGAEALVLWVALALCAAVLWRRTVHRLWPWSWMIVSLLAAAEGRRLTALAALTLVLSVMPEWTRGSSLVGVRPAWTPRRRLAAAATIAVAFAFAARSIVPTLGCFPPLENWRAPEPDAVAFLRAAAVHRVVPHFDYGEYAIYHLRDRAKVAIDNRRETVYSQAVVDENQHFADGLDPEYPIRIGADAVWWPAGDRRVIEPLESRGWVKRFEGPKTVVLTRTPGDITRGRDSVGTPCFPNP